MTRLFLFLSGVFVALSVTAQSSELLTSTFINPGLFNPSFISIPGHQEIAIGASYSAPNGTIPYLFYNGGSAQTKKQHHWRAIPKRWQSFGAAIIQNEQNDYQSTLSYSYNFPLFGRIKLSTGVRAGLSIQNNGSKPIYGAGATVYKTQWYIAPWFNHYQDLRSKNVDLIGLQLGKHTFIAEKIGVVTAYNITKQTSTYHQMGKLGLRFSNRQEFAFVAGDNNGFFFGSNLALLFKNAINLQYQVRKYTNHFQHDLVLKLRLSIHGSFIHPGNFWN